MVPVFGLNEISAFAHFLRICYLAGMAHVIAAWSQLNIRSSVSIKWGACCGLNEISASAHNFFYTAFQFLACVEMF